MKLERQKGCLKIHEFSHVTIFPPAFLHGTSSMQLFYKRRFCVLGGGALISGAPLFSQSPGSLDDIEGIIEPMNPSPEGSMTDALELKDTPIWAGWYWIGGGVWLVILALVFFLTRKRKKNQQKSLPAIPPHESALTGLQEIWLMQDQLDDKVFASLLSDVLRSYIEETFALRAPERTTEEFFEEASQHSDLKGDFAKRLEEFLSLIDLVKFARMPLAYQKREKLYQAGILFVEESHQSLLLKIPPELSVSAQKIQEDET
ncbi:MAG: hypothetical protein HN996_02210 [Opitutae bacterium]|nr:hypothetical protein [Opitutae bacterium]